MRVVKNKHKERVNPSPQKGRTIVTEERVCAVLWLLTSLKRASVLRKDQGNGKSFKYFFHGTNLKTWFFFKLLISVYKFNSVFDVGISRNCF